MLVVEFVVETLDLRAGYGKFAIFFGLNSAESYHS